MKKQICIFSLILLFAGISYGQTEKSYNDYLVKESNPVALKYADPDFPAQAFVPGVKNDKMEEYAKLHQPIPLKQNTGNAEYDKKKCEQNQASWLQQNPYYPQFIPYHIYNRMLTPEDDIAFFEAAKAAWGKANVQKFQEVESARSK